MMKYYCPCTILKIVMSSLLNIPIIIPLSVSDIGYQAIDRDSLGNCVYNKYLKEAMIISHQTQ